VPTGAYYVLAETTSIPGSNGRERARRLLKDTGVAAVAGSAFFGTDANGTNRGEDLLRFCFAKKDDELAEAARRIAACNY
jgi:aminotransferase